MSEQGAPDHLPVIAIGASAGGLEACRGLLKRLPGDTQAAFILILHLDPTHDSMMVDCWQVTQDWSSFRHPKA